MIRSARGGKRCEKRAFARRQRESPGRPRADGVGRRDLTRIGRSCPAHTKAAGACVGGYFGGRGSDAHPRSSPRRLACRAFYWRYALLALERRDQLAVGEHLQDARLAARAILRSVRTSTSGAAGGSYDSEIPVEAGDLAGLRPAVEALDVALITVSSGA